MTQLPEVRIAIAKDNDIQAVCCHYCLDIEDKSRKIHPRSTFMLLKFTSSSCGLVEATVSMVTKMAATNKFLHTR